MYDHLPCRVLLSAVSIDRSMQVPSMLVVMLFLIWLKRLLEETWQLRRLCPRRIKTGTATASRWNCHAFFVFLAVNGSFHAFLDWVYLAISGSSLYFLWSFEPYPLRRSLDRIRGKLGDDVQITVAYTSRSNRPQSRTHTQTSMTVSICWFGIGGVQNRIK